MSGWTNGSDYTGRYTVELYEGAPVYDLPIGAYHDVSQATVTVKHGRLVQLMGGIQFTSGTAPMRNWGYKWIKRLLDADGNPLWVNMREDR